MSTSSRIVFDARYVNDRYHGIGRYAFRLLEALVAAAPHHTFVVVRGQGQNSRFDWTPLAARPNVEMVAGPWPLYWPHEQLLWPLLLRRVRADLFHCPYFVAPLLARLPAILTVHDLIFERYPAYMPQAWARPYYRLLMRWGPGRAQRVIAVSQATARDLRHFYHPPAGRIRVIGEAPDPTLAPVHDQDTLRQLRARYDLPRPFILTVGARRPHKNLARLVQAFARLTGTVPHDLVLLGTADERFPDAARQAAQAAELNGTGPHTRIRFPGWAPEADLPGLYTLADVVAVPSLVEGFGLPALEAMACGTPVLAGDASSLPEVVGDAGLLADPTDVDALASGLHRLLTDADLRKRLARSGRERAATFTWDNVARATLDLYDEVLR